MYPLYLNTLVVDYVREDEYPHLEANSHSAAFGGLFYQAAADAHGHAGVMAYPVMSCCSGTENSLPRIREARQNGWHVLVDVFGLRAKAMDTLRLNLFHPGFIVGSFYRVFGSDPTGFGCLEIKKSMIRCLGDSSRARAIGMVGIVSTAGTSSISTSGSWDSVRSSLSNELHHCISRSSALLRENGDLNSQFEERFGTSSGPLLQFQMKEKAPWNFLAPTHIVYSHSAWLKGGFNQNLQNV